MPTNMGNIAEHDKAALFNLITLITGDEPEAILSGTLDAHKQGDTITLTYTHFERTPGISGSRNTDKSAVIQISE